MSDASLLRGKAHVYRRAHVNTDEIIPARFLNVHDEALLAKHAMEDIDPGFVARVAPGDLLVAGEDFGCGSSREHAVWALRGAGIRAVIATSFARIFFRNSLNNGFLALECPGAADALVTGDEVELDLAAGVLRAGEAFFPFVPPSDFARALLSAGGLLPYIETRRRELEAARCA